MKLSQLLFTVACLSVIFVLFSGVCSALEQDEARANPIWSNETPDQGTTVTLKIFYINDYVEPVTIQKVGVHLDWMEEDNFVGQDLTDEPVTVPGSDGYLFPPITIVIPQDASYGTHTYFISVELVDGDYWDSPTKTIKIQPAGEDGTNGGSGGGDSAGQPDTLLIIVGVAAVAIVTVLIVLIIFRRKK